MMEEYENNFNGQDVGSLPRDRTFSGAFRHGFVLMLADMVRRGEL